ncbi:MAG: prolyl oligopeptidase family serine peptidase [Planctomycetes bacterium]|nr:prolyl oligopeptidase family serine peptidase [Planctomycetota bacterium]
MLALVLLAALGCAAPVSDSIVPKNWLVIEPVDKSGRRPLRPDAVFAKHLLARDAAPPKKDEVLRGEQEKDCVWKEAQAKDDGTLEGSIGWAYTAIEAPADGVWMAKLPGASQLYVNGSGFVGDPYSLGFGGVPVALKQGRNDVFVAGVRGSCRLELWMPEKELFVASWDVTLPDRTPDRAPAGLLVVNASKEARSAFGETLAPLSVRKLAFESGARATFEVELDGAAYRWELPAREAGGPRRCTFVSDEDDSVQEYALRPATKEQQAVVLSLHGAGVDCWGQISSYSGKPEFTILAPTNRRQFGFDWQDWGRTNAYEALRAAFGEIPHALYLTGHSMGGHGTWSLAANDPDAFAAIAPSAGWSSFDSYGGRPKGELAERWQDADASSRTLTLLDNLVQIPTFILHGTADDNVPVSEAQMMEKALSAAGHPPQVHYQEGAGHWWDGDRASGADCVDWPEIFELFRSAKPRPVDERLHFLSVDPSVNATNGLVAVLQLERYGEPAEVTLQRGAKGELVPEAKNVRRMQIGAEAVSVPPGEKTPEFSGPFKRAFRRHFVLVYGTQGTPEENRELYERARCDSEIWWYRGNGRARLVSDTEYLGLKRESCNAILYGNADTNRVWKERVGKDAPVQVRRGSVKLGEREWRGDGLVTLAVYPSTQQGELFGLVGDTGPKGTRLGYTTAYFVSGVGYPDYTIFGPGVLAKGDGGVLATGWFDAQWKLDGRGFLREDAK